MDYLAKSVGAQFEETDSTIKVDDEAHTVADGKITLDKTAVAFTDCVTIYAYAKKIYDATTSKAIADDDYHTCEVKANNEIDNIDGTLVDGDKYCVKYFINTSSAKSIKVASNYVPATFHIVLKVNLYAAGQSDANATRAGYLLIDIPRFQLDGSQDLSMSMTGASTTSLKGSALATEGCTNASCDADNYYAIMTEVLEDGHWYDGAKFLAVEGGDFYIPATGEATIAPLDHIYVVYASGAPKLLSAIGDAQVTITPTDVTASGTLTYSAETKKITLASGFTSGGFDLAITGTDLALKGVDVVREQAG